MVAVKGKKCKRCGGVTRYKSSNRCVDCMRKRNKKRDPDKRCLESLNTRNAGGSSFVYNAVMRSRTVEVVPSIEDLYEIKEMVNLVKMMNGNEQVWEIDHLYPIAGEFVEGLGWKVGTTTVKNLAIKTRKSNRSKGNKIIDENVGEYVVIKEKMMVNKQDVDVEAVKKNSVGIGDWFKTQGRKFLKSEEDTAEKEARVVKEKKEAMNELEGYDFLYRKLVTERDRYVAEYGEAGLGEKYRDARFDAVEKWVKLLDVLVVDHEESRLSGGTVLALESILRGDFIDLGRCIQDRDWKGVELITERLETIAEREGTKYPCSLETSCLF